MSTLQKQKMVAHPALTALSGYKMHYTSYLNAQPNFLALLVSLENQKNPLNSADFLYTIITDRLSLSLIFCPTPSHCLDLR
jgi:hypothetical protein